MKKNLLLLFALISSFQFVSAQTLSSAPILTFTNNTGISTDNIASDGDGGSVNISDFDIQFYNISNEAGTFVGPLSWENASFYFAGSFTGITSNVGTGTKGMEIKSVTGAEFKLYQFDYLNWGESFSAINMVKGYRDGVEVASTTFEGFCNPFVKKTITFSSSFENVDEVRFYINAGGYQGSQQYTNHSINAIKIGTPVAPVLNSNDFAIADAFKIYPITATSGVTIEKQFIDKTLLNVYDSAGKLMFKEDLKLYLNIIDVKQLSSGLYFFNIISSKGSFTQKIIKN